MAEFKLKKGQKIYHIREFSSVLELARRKLIAPGDPIFVPSVGRWVYASAIQELRPILQDPDRPADDALELPLEFVEPLSEDLIGGLTVEIDADDFGVGISAVEKRLEPLPLTDRTRELLRQSSPAIPVRQSSPPISVRQSSPAIPVRPPEPSAADWSDETPTDPGRRVSGGLPQPQAVPRAFADVIPPVPVPEGARFGARASGDYEVPRLEAVRARDSLELQARLGPDYGRSGGMGGIASGPPDQAPPFGQPVSRYGRAASGYGPAQSPYGAAGGYGPAQGPYGDAGGYGPAPSAYGDPGGYGPAPSAHGDAGGYGPASSAYGANGPGSLPSANGAAGGYGSAPFPYAGGNGHGPAVPAYGEPPGYGPPPPGYSRGGNGREHEPGRFPESARGSEFELNPYAPPSSLQGHPPEQSLGYGARQRELEPVSARPQEVVSPAQQGWMHGRGRKRSRGEKGETVPAPVGGGRLPALEPGPSHRPGSGELHSPVPFQDWVEEQSRRTGVAAPPRDLTPLIDVVVEPKPPPPKRRFNPIRLAVLVTLVLGVFGAFFWYVRSTANLDFKPLGAQASPPPAPTPLPAPVIVNPAAPDPVTLADDRRLRELIRPQQSPMRTFDQAQDELFGELVNLKVAVADVKLDPVEGARTQSIRTGASNLTVRIKEGRFTVDEQTALVGLVAGKYAKRKPQDQNRLNLSSLVVQIERDGDEPLVRQVSGATASDYFNRVKDVRQFLLEAQAGTVVP